MENKQNEDFSFGNEITKEVYMAFTMALREVLTKNREKLENRTDLFINAVAISVDHLLIGGLSNIDLADRALSTFYEMMLYNRDIVTESIKEQKENKNGK